MSFALTSTQIVKKIGDRKFVPYRTLGKGLINGLRTKYISQWSLLQNMAWSRSFRKKKYSWLLCEHFRDAIFLLEHISPLVSNPFSAPPFGNSNTIKASSSLVFIWLFAKLISQHWRVFMKVKLYENKFVLPVRLGVSTAFINLCGFFGSCLIIFLSTMTLPHITTSSSLVKLVEELCQKLKLGS